MRATFSVVLTGAAFAAFTAAGAACTITEYGPRSIPGPTGAEVFATSALGVKCDDTLESIDGPPGALTDPPGTIYRCAKEKSLTRAEMQMALDAAGFVGEPAISGATLYRILYRTERATVPVTPGYSSGIVLLPDAPRAEKVPVVSVSHGAGGQSPKCAQSKQGFANPKSDFLAMTFGMVAGGFAVVASDYAGFNHYGAPGNPPSGMAYSADVARSTLDSLRAIRKMAPNALSDDNFLVGQSQGGHTVLSTLALAEGYAPEVKITGVKAFTPLWFNQASWGGIFALGDTFALARDTFPTAVGIWYLYSHAAIMDGVDHAADVFAPDKRAVVKDFFDNYCGNDGHRVLKAVAKIPADLYDPDFVASLTSAAAFGEKCDRSDPKQQALCEKWVARYAADRPHITGKAKEVPILLTYGGKDTTIPPERATCGIDRLRRDGARLKVCFDKAATHSSIVKTQGGLAVAWVASLALGEGAPSTACEGDESAIVDGAGAPAECATLPPND